MPTIPATVLALAVTLAALPALAAPSAATPPASASAEASSSSAPAAVVTPSGDVPSTPAIAGSFSFADIVGGIATAKPSPAIAAITAKTRVTFIELHMLAGYDPAAVNFSPDQVKAIATLEAAIGRSRSLEAKLRKAGYLLSDVVAVALDAGGNPVVFVNL